MTIKLKSKDGKEFQISKEACEKSKYLKEQLKDKNELTLDSVDGEDLKLVVDYLNYYSKNELSKLPDKLTSSDLKAQLTNFDYKFISPSSFEVTFHLINAGLLFELEHLHDLACIKIAAFMRDKDLDEINKQFSFECQLTPEEAKELGLEEE